MASKKRKGRPPKFVRDPNDGREIYGLSLHETFRNGKCIKHRYYATFSKPRFYLGSDFGTAYQRFLAWQAKQSLDFTVVEINEQDHIEEFIEPVFVTDIVDKRKFYRYDIPRPVLLEQLKTLIQESDPKQLAKELGIPELEWIWKAQKPTSITVEQLGEPFIQEKENQLTPKEWANSKAWWKEFSKIVSAKKVCDLNRAAFLKYRDRILAVQRKRNLSNTYSRSRFGKIKAIINYCVDQSPYELSEVDRLALANRTVLRNPPKPKPTPIMISPAEFKQLLRVSDAWQKALLLIALNGAFQTIDICRLTWKMVDFEESTLRFNRSKSSSLADGDISRITVLWERTLNAISELPKDGPFIFHLKGKQIAGDTVRRRFEKAHEKSGIKKKREKTNKPKLLFKHIRKSAISAASNNPTVPDRHIDLLAGHSTGIKEHYVVAEQVRQAVDAIEQAYFG